ncbi:MAG: fumarate hydratase [Clostridia bacterium]|nr:fumarate hydratase [Clostridia bacterium]
MREISCNTITEAISELFIKANRELPCDLLCKILDSAKAEESEIAKSVMSDIVDNIDAAKKLCLPICQDTGMAVVFIDVGQDVHIVGGNFEEAINQGVRQGYQKGLLRKSVVSDPLLRKNTEDNTPAIIHTRIVDGEHIKITACPKGFGSENMSGIRMLTPSAQRQGVINAVLEIVKSAGANPCPPIVVGVGIGGDFEQCALLSKKALCRDIDLPNENPFYAEFEKEMLEKINKLGIGPQGFGGKTTALAVNIETAPTHIAGLPVAVNIGCHVTRHATKII